MKVEWRKIRSHRKEDTFWELYIDFDLIGTARYEGATLVFEYGPCESWPVLIEVSSNSADFDESRTIFEAAYREHALDQSKRLAAFAEALSPK